MYVSRAEEYIRKGFPLSFAPHATTCLSPLWFGSPHHRSGPLPVEPPARTQSKTFLGPFNRGRSVRDGRIPLLVSTFLATLTRPGSLLPILTRTPPVPPSRRWARHAASPLVLPASPVFPGALPASPPAPSMTRDRLGFRSPFTACSCTVVRGLPSTRGCRGRYSRAWDPPQSSRASPNPEGQGTGAYLRLLVRRSA